MIQRIVRGSTVKVVFQIPELVNAGEHLQDYDFEGYLRSEGKGIPLTPTNCTFVDQDTCWMYLDTKYLNVGRIKLQIKVNFTDTQYQWFEQWLDVVIVEFDDMPVPYIDWNGNETNQDYTCTKLIYYD